MDIPLEPSPVAEILAPSLTDIIENELSSNDPEFSNATALELSPDVEMLPPAINISTDFPAKLLILSNNSPGAKSPVVTMSELFRETEEGLVVS